MTEGRSGQASLCGSRSATNGCQQFERTVGSDYKRGDEESACLMVAGGVNRQRGDRVFGDSEAFNVGFESGPEGAHKNDRACFFPEEAAAAGGTHTGGHNLSDGELLHEDSGFHMEDKGPFTVPVGPM